MEIEIIVVIIAGVFSLLGAAISYRMASKSMRSVEFLKHRQTLSLKTSEIVDIELRDCLNALKNSIGCIQKVKDEIQVVLSAMDTSLYSDDAIKLICIARERLFADYENYRTFLNELETQAFHHAKSMALDTEVLLKSELTGKSYASQISPSGKESIIRLRFELTDAQNLLRDSRINRLLERTVEGSDENVIE